MVVSRGCGQDRRGAPELLHRRRRVSGDARALEAAGIDSIWIREHDSDLDPWLLLAAIAAATSRVRLGLILAGIGEPAQRLPQLETLNRLSRSRGLWGLERGRAVEVPARAGAPAERWIEPTAVDAAALETARAEETSVLLPMAPGLLDLLRRPDQADDRSDLILSQG